MTTILSCILWKSNERTIFHYEKKIFRLLGLFHAWLPAVTQLTSSTTSLLNLLSLNSASSKKHFLSQPFQERQFLVASIVIEFIVSFSYYIIRDWYLSELNPTTLFLALFIRSQLTSTITMVLIFLPKIYYQHKQVRNDSDPLFIVIIKRLHPVLASFLRSRAN